MRLASLHGRAVVVADGVATDVHTSSDGDFGPTTEDVLARWPAFRSWAAGGIPAGEVPWVPESAGPVVAAPRQVFAAGLNYRAHALEAGMALPEVPMVFTKFPSCVAAPFGDVPVPTPKTDWEVEVTVVVGSGGYRIAEADAWDAIAGVTCAQDYSARDTQFASKANAQFSLGKSYPGFLPLGPLLVTPDEYPDRDAIALSCHVNGVERQRSTTADLVFGVPALVAYISSICPLLPGDLILTGTPAGVGMGLDPPVFLRPGDEVVSEVELAGRMRQRCVAP